MEHRSLCYTRGMNEVVSGDRIAKAAVLGAGTMGHGIGQVLAAAGIQVALRDVDQAAADAGLARIRGNLDKGIARGKVTEDQRDQTLARLTATVDVAESVADADVVIEAAPEKLDLKVGIFREVEAAAPAHALLATNTSSLSIASIANQLDRPERLVGMHFFNPVFIMKLVEVVHHADNAPAAVDSARDLAVRIGKTPIVVRDAPGFASSRLGLVIGLEAMRMVEQKVASPADIDRAMTLGYAHPMGPPELTDLVGLDVRLHIAEYLQQEIGASFAPPQILRDLVAEGKLGKKSGRGFYEWRDGKAVK